MNNEVNPQRRHGAGNKEKCELVFCAGSFHVFIDDLMARIKVQKPERPILLSLISCVGEKESCRCRALISGQNRKRSGKTVTRMNSNDKAVTMIAVSHAPML